MNIFYKDTTALKEIEEPYKTALTILEELYVEVPEEKEHLNYISFPDYLAINAVRQICEHVKENPLPYISIISSFRDRLYQVGNSRLNKFEGFRVGKNCEATVILGGVYYVLAVNGTLNEKQLEKVEIIATWEKKAEYLPYFKVFKEAVANFMAQKPQSEDTKKAKGFSPSQAGLFCEALLSFHNCSITNKKKAIGSLASDMFGWAESTIERQVCSGGREERNYVADVFKDYDAEFSDYIRSFGNKNPTAGDSKTAER